MMVLAFSQFPDFQLTLCPLPLGVGAGGASAPMHPINVGVYEELPALDDAL